MPHDAYPNALPPLGIVPSAPASLAPFSSNESRARRLRPLGATV